VCKALGAQEITGLRDSVTIPRQTGAGTAQWLASESTAISESNQVFTQIAASPKNVGVYTEISRQLNLQSPALSRVAADQAKALGNAMDLAALAGSGASGQPLGIIGTSGVGSVTGATLDYADIIEFQSDVLAGKDVDLASAGYVTTPAVASLLMQRYENASNIFKLWQGNLNRGTMCGIPAMASSQMPAATMIFGCWSGLTFLTWGTLELEVNPYAGFQAGIIGVRTMASCDVAIDPSVFSVASSIT
jgi:HK97 family phage major capsid protein